MSLVESSSAAAQRPTPQEQYQKHQRQQAVRNLQLGKRVEVELTEELCNDIRAAFNLFDTTQTGKVEVGNLGTILRCCGLQPTEVQLRRHVAGLVAHEVTLGQVIAVAEAFQDKRVPKSEIRRVYAEVFNADGKGVDPRALMAASRNMHEKPLSLQEAEQMIAWLQREDGD